MGLHVVGREGEERAIESLVAPTVSSYESGVFFRLSLEHRFHAVRKWIDSSGIEVTSAGEGEYVISDAPVVATEFDASEGVIRRDVGLARAQQFIMPVTPSLTVSLKTGPDQLRTADASEVDICNSLQINGARSHVFFRPG